MVRPIASAIGRTRGSRRLGLALLQSQAAEALGWSQAAVPGCAMKVSAPSVRLERVKPRPVVRKPDPVSSNVTLIDPPEVLSHQFNESRYVMRFNEPFGERTNFILGGSFPFPYDFTDCINRPACRQQRASQGPPGPADAQGIVQRM